MQKLPEKIKVKGLGILGLTSTLVKREDLQIHQMLFLLLIMFEKQIRIVPWLN